MIYKDFVTLEINSAEEDYEIRGEVGIDHEDYRGPSAVVDGPVEALVDGKWIDLDEIRGLDSESRMHAIAALEECALEDDSEACAQDDAGEWLRELAAS